MNKILILAALMLTGCDDYDVKGSQDSLCVTYREFASYESDVNVKCLPLTSENIKKMQALADELNGLEK